jgi:catechol 2,3-dioxygenase-like lactoylglutathione lyase family enzyme
MAAAIYKRAVPYAEDATNLPVRSVEQAIPFYEIIIGFRVVERRDAPHDPHYSHKDPETEQAVVLSARSTQSPPCGETPSSQQRGSKRQRIWLTLHALSRPIPSSDRSCHRKYWND